MGGFHRICVAVAVLCATAVAPIGADAQTPRRVERRAVVTDTPRSAVAQPSVAQLRLRMGVAEWRRLQSRGHELGTSLMEALRSQDADAERVLEAYADRLRSFETEVARAAHREPGTASAATQRLIVAPIERERDAYRRDVAQLERASTMARSALARLRRARLARTGATFVEPTIVDVRGHVRVTRRERRVSRTELASEQSRVEGMIARIRERSQAVQTEFEHLDQMVNQTMQSISRLLRTMQDMRSVGAAGRSGL